MTTKTFTTEDDLNREQGRERIEDFDWLSLMRGITQVHVEGLQSSANILDVAPRYWCPTSGNQYQNPGKCPECGDTLEEVSDVADKATGTAPDTDSPMVGTGGGVPLSTSPLQQFDAPSSQERSGSDQRCAAGHVAAPIGTGASDRSDIVNREDRFQVPTGQPRGVSIHSGDTIDRLIDAVAVCEERSRG